MQDPPTKRTCSDPVDDSSDQNSRVLSTSSTMEPLISTTEPTLDNDVSRDVTECHSTNPIIGGNKPQSTESSEPADNTSHRASKVPPTATPYAEGTRPSSATPNHQDIGTFFNCNLSDDDRYKLIRNAWTPTPSFTYPTHQEHGKLRKFQSQWLQNYPWLAYSKTCDGGICKYCFSFSKVGRPTVLVNQTLKLFNKATDKLKAHDKSELHKNAMAQSDNFLRVMDKKNSTIHEQVNTALTERIAKNRQKLTSIIKTVIFCGRQNIALRGNHESDSALPDSTNRGNFKALLEFRAEAGDSVLDSHIKHSHQNATYTSPKIQNEIITIIKDNIQQQIVKEVHVSKYFSVLADEVTDTSNKEQLSIVLRYVDSENKVQEHFMDFIECRNGITGEALAQTILQCMKDLGLDAANIRGQGYDGASNMSGLVKGAAAVIQRDHPAALYLHCASHQLNLCIVKSAENRHVRNMMGTMEKVWLFFEGHPKRQVKLETAIIETAPEASHFKLKNMCRTRWVQRLDALETFTELLPSIVRCFESICEEGSKSWSKDSLTDASMFCLAITQVYFPIALIITRHIMAYLRGITVSLQAQALDIVRASQEVQTVQATLEKVRTEVESYHNRW